MRLLRLLKWVVPPILFVIIVGTLSRPVSYGSMAAAVFIPAIAFVVFHILQRSQSRLS
jgi:hypothetical protein